MMPAKVGMTWAEREAAIEAAFRRLPIWRPGNPEVLSYESLIPGIGRQLLLMKGNEPPPNLKTVDKTTAAMWKGVAALRRHTETASTSATRRELANLEKRAAALLNAIDALHKPAIDALNYRKEALIGPAGLTTKLRVLSAAASHATIPELPATVGRGRKTKDQPHRIALAAAQHFYGLTGKIPTVIVPSAGGKARGPFVKLLTEIFAAVGVAASAEYHAREAARAMEGYRSKKVK
jgi:hypothetical protein